MSYLLPFVCGLAGAGVAAAILAVWLRRRLPAAKPEDDRGLLLVQQQMDALREQLGTSLDRSSQSAAQQLGQLQTQVNQQLGHLTAQLNQRLQDTSGTLQKVNESIGQRLDNAARVVGDVQKKLGEIGKVNEQVLLVGKDISSLQEMLRAPKFRGAIGELLLEDLLKQILPAEHFEIQHAFRTGDRVDAVIRLGQGLVPVDAKFPLANFRRFVESAGDDERKAARRQFIRDVKAHIDAIAKKYILPDEGTLDFALMYIPAENVYYETIIKSEGAGEDADLFQYAVLKRVIPVSPNSFYAYLQTILLGLKGLRIEERAQEILAHLKRLRGDFSRFQSDFDKLGTHLGNARGAYEDANSRLGKLDDKLGALESPEAPVTTPRLEREAS